MSKLVIILGETGHGKSRSIKNLDPSSTAIINVAGKDLPFKGWKGKYTPRDPEKAEGNIWTTQKSSTIVKILRKISAECPEFKTIIIDDFQYVMSFEFMERATERGYDKFSEIAQNALNILRAASELRPDITVFILAHSENVYDANSNLKIKMKTIGKLLDEKITIEGLSSIVLLAKIIKTDTKIKYCFITNSDGTATIKSPEEMFELEIPNDLQLVLDKIHEYDN